MQTPRTLSIWLGEQAWPLAVIAIVLAILLLSLLVSARHRRRRMNASRSEVNEDSFVEALEVHGFDPVVALSTYRYLQTHQKVSFPMHPEDLLDEDLGLDNVDVEESVQDLLDQTGRVYRPGLKHMPIVTVEDLVRFVQASPRLSELAA